MAYFVSTKYLNSSQLTSSTGTLVSLLPTYTSVALYVAFIGIASKLPPPPPNKNTLSTTLNGMNSSMLTFTQQAQSWRSVEYDRPNDPALWSHS